METLASSFDDALEMITVNGQKQKDVQAAHEEVTQVLTADTKLREWGIWPILIGSYARSTAVYPGNDVDVFLRLTNLDISASPLVVYDRIAAVLRDAYPDSVEDEPPRRAVKVSFEKVGEGFSIDAVPAVPWGTNWGIPGRDRTVWASATPEARWVLTNPLSLKDLTTTMNATAFVGSRGAYVPTVKLIRQIRAYHRGSERPRGLFFELMTYWAFAGGLPGESFAEFLSAALNSCVQQLDDCLAGNMILDPVLATPFAPAPSQQELSDARAAFAPLAVSATSALDMDECGAAAAWRAIVGRNERGWCITLPDGCGEDGRRIDSVRVVSSRGRREGGRYGRPVA
jgi:hypothetical protein